VHGAATVFRDAAGISEGVGIRLEKTIPLAAGLGGGSSNAATTLLGLNELFGQPLSPEKLHELAAALGSDVPFFLQNKPALATGRGEKVEALGFFPALRGTVFALVHPGFGIATAWAYQQLARFPSALNGKAGRAQKLISLLQSADMKSAGPEFHNSLEAPALEKYPVLALFQEFFRENGAVATLMSGSGSTTFAVFQNASNAESVVEKFRAKFGDNSWLVIVPCAEADR
jgi:4-diphosphocytidyl-2-C-methyl-D-erythritol kinase